MSRALALCQALCEGPPCLVLFDPRDGTVGTVPSCAHKRVHNLRKAISLILNQVCMTPEANACNYNVLSLFLDFEGTKAMSLL